MLSLVAAVVMFIFLQVGFVSSVIAVMLPHGGFRNKSFFQMPKHIQFFATAIVVIFHCFPIVVSAVTYIALLIGVSKVKQQKEQQIIEDNYQSRIFNNVYNSAQDHLTNQENSLGDHSVQNIESSVHSSIGDRSIPDEDVGPINTLSGQITKNLQSIQPRVICIDLDLTKSKQCSIDSRISSTTKGENAMPKAKPDCTIIKKQKREENEQNAALRSMKTNLMMILMIAAVGLTTLAPTMKWKLFSLIIFESLLKCIMPIVTTLSNFGPTKKIAKMYFYLIKYQLTDISST